MAEHVLAFAQINWFLLSYRLITDETGEIWYPRGNSEHVLTAFQANEIILNDTIVALSRKAAGCHLEVEFSGHWFSATWHLGLTA